MAMLVLLGAPGAAPSRAEPQTADPPAVHTAVQAGPDDPWSSPEVAAPRMDAHPLPRGRTTASRGPATPSSDRPAANPWFRTTLALGGVVSLIVLLAWGYRRAASGGTLGFSLRGRQANIIEVIGRTALSPRQSVCLVRVGPRLVLLGCTPDAVRALDIIQDPVLTAQLVGQAAQAWPGSHTADFARSLEREARAYPAAGHSEPAEETMAPEEVRLSAIKEMLSRTVGRVRAAADGAKRTALAIESVPHP